MSIALCSSPFTIIPSTPCIRSIWHHFGLQTKSIFRKTPETGKNSTAMRSTSLSMFSPSLQQVMASWWKTSLSSFALKFRFHRPVASTGFRLRWRMFILKHTRFSLILTSGTPLKKTIYFAQSRTSRWLRRRRTGRSNGLAVIEAFNKD